MASAQPGTGVAIEWTPFFRMLGIPEQVTEPTVYQLLGLADPRAVTPELVAEALNNRKKLLRQNIPGPQFIPLVSVFERKLDDAAAILLDPEKRKAYHERIRDQARARQKAGTTEAARLEQVKAALRIIRQTINRDGTLEESKRPALAGRLARMGIPERNVRATLAQIPRPAPKQAHASTPTMDFFANAVDLAVSEGVLAEVDERQLVDLARKLNIPRATATEMIDQRLNAQGARRGERDAALLKARFERQVRILCPDRRATPQKRQSLLSLASSLGVPAQSAEQVLQQCLESPESPPPRGEESAAVVSTEDDEMAEILELIRGPANQRRRCSLQRVFAVGVPVISIALFSLFVLAYSTSDMEGKSASQVLKTVVDRILHPSSPAPGPEGPRPPTDLPPEAPDQGESPAPLDGGGPAQPPPDRGTVVCDVLLKAVHSPRMVKEVVSGLTPHEVEAALKRAAGLLTNQATQAEIDRAERLFSLLFATPLEPGTQNAIIQALLDALRQAPDESSGRRPARLLSTALFLNPNPPSFTPRPLFAQRCDQVWRESLAAQPSDPLNDAQRLARAAAEGGDLAAYARRVDALRFAAVVKKLAGSILEPSSTGSAEVLRALEDVAHRHSRVPQEARKTARLALCEILRRAENAEAVRRARQVLVSALEVGADSSLSAGDLDAPAERKKVADKLAVLIEGLSPPGAGPAVSPGEKVDLPAREVRRAYSTSGRPEALLADATLNLLACCDRAARFAAGSYAWSAELRRALASRDLPAELISNVAVAAGTAAEPEDFSLPDDESASMKKLEEHILSPVAALRYRAIEELRILNTAEATEILLAAFERRAKGDIKTASRILRALRTMRSPKIPAGLIETLAKSNPLVAHLTVQSLIEESGLYTRGRRGALLPRNHTRQQLQDCVHWWEDKRKQGRVFWGKSRRGAVTPGAPFGPAGDEKDHPSWEPDPLISRLLAAAVYYAAHVSRALEAYRWDGTLPAGQDPRGEPELEEIAVGPEVGKALLAALDAVVDQLGRVVREHPGGETYATRADVIGVQRKARTLASDTVLQKMAVSLDAAAGLLELLVEEVDPQGRLRARLESVRREHEQALAAAPDVLHELRACGYYNLVLWDLMLETKD